MSRGVGSRSARPHTDVDFVDAERFLRHTSQEGVPKRAGPIRRYQCRCLGPWVGRELASSPASAVLLYFCTFSRHDLQSILLDSENSYPKIWNNSLQDSPSKLNPLYMIYTVHALLLIGEKGVILVPLFVQKVRLHKDIWAFVLYPSSSIISSFRNIAAL